MERINQSLRQRFILIKPLWSILILTLFIMGSIQFIYQYGMKSIVRETESQYRQNLIQIVSIARNTIEPILIQLRSDKITRQAALDQIRAIVRFMTYQDQYGYNYIFMSSYQGIMLVQPYEPEKEMTNQWDLQDVNGLYIIRELVRAAQTIPHGSFVRYSYYLPGVHAPQEKLAYVVGLKELDCYIGTGMYMQKAISEQQAMIRRIQYASIGLFGLVFIPILFSIVFIMERNKRLSAEIAHRKKIESELVKSEAHYRSIFNNVMEGIFQSSPDGYFINVNPALARIAGYNSPQEMINSHIHVDQQYYLKKVDREIFLKIIEEKGFIKDYELKLRRHDGSIGWAMISVWAVRDESGKTMYYEGTIEDITEQRQAEEALIVSRKQLNDILQAASEFSIIATDTEGIITLFNRGAERMLGYSADEIIGKVTLLQFHSESEVMARSQELASEYRSPIEGVCVFTIKPDLEGAETREWTYIRKDGSTFPVSLVITTVHSEQGEITGYLSIATDITVRKRNEMILRESEERLKVITTSLPGVVFQLRIDAEGHHAVTYASEQLQEIIGISLQEQNLYSALYDRIYPEDRPRFEAEIQKAVTNFEPWDFEGRFFDYWGKIRWFHGLSLPSRYDNGLVFNGILLDITGRKKAEEMSHLSEEKFRKIFMTVPDGIAITRMDDGLLIDVNHGFEDISGWSVQELIGTTSLKIGFWNDPQERFWMVDTLKQYGEVLYQPTRFRRKDGEVRSGIYSARSIQIADSGHIIFVISDVTDRIQLEDERRKIEQQLFQSQKMDAIGQLASGLAHDFNNILMGIQGNISLIRFDTPSDHPHFERLGMIEDHIQRGARLTRQLLGFAKGGAYEINPVSINELIGKSIHFFSETRKDIQTEFDPADGLERVEVDAGQIEQVLLNLFINAGHAMPQGGRLMVKTSAITIREEQLAVFKVQPGRYVKISIADTGVGMDKETLSRIFEPFYTTRADQGGTGLGLALTYGIIRNHRGIINVYSEPGHGSVFTIYLPASEHDTHFGQQSPSITMLPGHGGILLVDDESMILDTASLMLSSLGYTVFPANDDRKALSLFQDNHHSIHLIILDMIIPGMDTAQMLSALKQIDPQCKIILTSGYGPQGEVQRLIEKGCDGFIQKPYTLNMLSQVVHQTLNPIPPA